MRIVSPSGSDGKESACNAGGTGLVPGLGRSPGEGHGNPLQCSCLGNSMDRATCQATVRGVAESDMTERLTLSLSKLSYEKKRRYGCLTWKLVTCTSELSGISTLRTQGNTSLALFMSSKQNI